MNERDRTKDRRKRRFTPADIRQIRHYAAQYGLAIPTVEAIATRDYPTAARRPADSRLDCGKLGRTFGIALPEWRDALNRTIKLMYVTEEAATTNPAPV